MINLEDYRLIDLSKKLTPGMALGPLYDKRRLEIREFTFPPGELMHQIDLESHIGTHVEVPSHFIPARYNKPARDLSEMPLETFMGEACFADLRGKKPGTPITIEYLGEENIQPRDILILGNGPYKGKELSRKNFIPRETAEWMVEKRIKMLGIDDSVLIEDPKSAGVSLEVYYTHDALLKNDIPYIESMTNLDKLKKKRFFFSALPVSIVGLDSFPVRAVAFEQK